METLNRPGWELDEATGIWFHDVGRYVRLSAWRPGWAVETTDLDGKRAIHLAGVDEPGEPTLKASADRAEAWAREHLHAPLSVLALRRPASVVADEYDRLAGQLGAEPCQLLAAALDDTLHRKEDDVAAPPPVNLRPDVGERPEYSYRFQRRLVREYERERTTVPVGSFEWQVLLCRWLPAAGRETEKQIARGGLTLAHAREFARKHATEAKRDYVDRPPLPSTSEQAAEIFRHRHLIQIADDAAARAASPKAHSFDEWPAWELAKGAKRCAEQIAREPDHAAYFQAQALLRIRAAIRGLVDQHVRVSNLLESSDEVMAPPSNEVRVGPLASPPRALPTTATEGL